MGSGRRSDRPGGARGGRAAAHTLKRIQSEVMVIVIAGGEKRSPIAHASLQREAEDVG
jgi:hypothetical protein